MMLSRKCYYKIIGRSLSIYDCVAIGGHPGGRVENVFSYFLRVGCQCNYPPNNLALMSSYLHYFKRTMLTERLTSGIFKRAQYKS